MILGQVTTEMLYYYIMPDYVKIDMSIVRGIDKDENRQKILKILSHILTKEILK